jgi:hypothetical protein
MTRESIAWLEENNPDERAFGFYGHDRYAWVVGNVERLTQPIPFGGSQGFPDIDDQLVLGQGALL